MRQDIVALLLEKDGRFLAEKRKESKATCPGDIVPPGGKVEPGETKEQALEREMQEELGIRIFGLRLVYQKDFDCEAQLRIHWYACERYEGTIQNNEAKDILWIEPDRFTYDVSREAISAFYSNTIDQG